MSGQKITKQLYARLDLSEQDIFEDLATGLPVTEAIRKYQVSKRIWYGWLDRKPGRRDEYKRAQRHFAETLADETIKIADSCIDTADAQIAKVRIDARRWVAGKVDPERYGEKQGPAVQINLQSEHLQALKDINNSEDAVSVGHSDRGE